MKTFHFELITPERSVFAGEVSSLTVPTEEGSLGVLANHAPLVAILGVGPLKAVRPDGVPLYFMVAEGFLEVADNKARALASTGERGDEIDLSRATRAEERARQRLKERGDPEFDLHRAEIALRRAMTRVKIVRDLAPHSQPRR